MNTTLTVSVTEKHRKKGSTNMCTRCPVALALGEACGVEFPASRWRLEVQPDTLRAQGDKYVVECETPPEVKAWLLNWDAGKDPGPLTFTVDAREAPAQLSRHWIHDLLFRVNGVSAT